MDLEFLTNRMARQADAIQGLALGVSTEQSRWKPDPSSWSILEVINHLYDEERSDFRIRLDIILHHPGQAFPPINPQSWVTERGYNTRDLIQSVDNFLEERQKSLAWLRGLNSPDWQAFVTAPFGNLSAGDMAAAWAVHDLLHLRQLVELHWAYTQQAVQPYQVKYAGEW